MVNLFLIKLQNYKCHFSFILVVFLDVARENHLFTYIISTLLDFIILNVVV